MTAKEKYLVVATDKLAELVRQNASAVLERKVRIGEDHLDVVLKVTGRSFQEANHQFLQVDESAV